MLQPDLRVNFIDFITHADWKKVVMVCGSSKMSGTMSQLRTAPIVSSHIAPIVLIPLLFHLHVIVLLPPVAIVLTHITETHPAVLLSPWLLLFPVLTIV